MSCQKDAFCIWHLVQRMVVSPPAQMIIIFCCTFLTARSRVICKAIENHETALYCAAVESRGGRVAIDTSKSLNYQGVI